MKTYEEYVNPFIKNFIKVSLDKDKVAKIKKFVGEIIKAKRREEHHIVNGYNEEKRFLTGFSGEAALEKLFDIEIIDWTIGDSARYHIPDLNSAGYNIGIKTVEFGKLPIVFKNSRRPEIIVIKIDDFNFYICGLATVNVLSKYQDDDSILSPSLKKRGTKTGFYGFEHLLKVEKLDDIKDYKING